MGCSHICDATWVALTFHDAPRVALLICDAVSRWISLAQNHTQLLPVTFITWGFYTDAIQESSTSLPVWALFWAELSNRKATPSATAQRHRFGGTLQHPSGGGHTGTSAARQVPTGRTVGMSPSLPRQPQTQSPGRGKTGTRKVPCKKGIWERPRGHSGHQCRHQPEPAIARRRTNRHRHAEPQLVQCIPLGRGQRGKEEVGPNFPLCHLLCCPSLLSCVLAVDPHPCPHLSTILRWRSSTESPPQPFTGHDSPHPTALVMPHAPTPSHQHHLPPTLAWRGTDRSPVPPYGSDVPFETMKRSPAQVSPARWLPPPAPTARWAPALFLQRSGTANPVCLGTAGSTARSAAPAAPAAAGWRRPRGR